MQPLGPLVEGASGDLLTNKESISQELISQELIKPVLPTTLELQACAASNQAELPSPLAGHELQFIDQWLHSANPQGQAQARLRVLMAFDPTGQVHAQGFNMNQG